MVIACNSSTGANSSITAEKLIESTEFQNVVESAENLNKPILEKEPFKQKEKLESFKQKVQSHLDNKTLKKTSSKEQLVLLMGYKDMDQYKSLFHSYATKVEKFHEKFPEIKNLESHERERIVSKAASQLVTSKNFAKNPDYDRMAKCESQLQGCIDDASSSFNRSTVLCGAASLVNLVGGITCQAANIAYYEAEKYNCVVDYDQCVKNPDS